MGDYTIFKNYVDSCKEEYDVFYPTGFTSKTCSKVVDRKCVINKYCNEDEGCIKDAQEFYYPYLVENDEEYCSCLVSAEKGEREFKECNRIK